MKTFTLICAGILAGVLTVQAAEPATLTASTSTNEPTIINSDHLEADYGNNLGTFTGNVLVVDPRMTLRADKMIVFFGQSGTNTQRTVQHILADGAVVISTPDNKKSNSDHAEYFAVDGRVVLTGSPQVQGPEGTSTGKKITFWQGQQKMEVESDPSDTNRTRTVIFPEDQRKQNENK